MRIKIKTKGKFVFLGVGAFLILATLVSYLMVKRNALAVSPEDLPIDLTDRSPSNSYKLTPEIIGTWAMPSGYTSAQSFAINNNDFVVIAAPKKNSGNNQNKIIKISRNNTNKASVVNSYNVGHGNGATWDAKNNQLLVVNEASVYRFDKNYNYIDTKSVLSSKSGKALKASGIAYDSLNKKYWVSSGSVIRRVNMNTWKAVDVTSSNHVQVNQDMGYHDGFIYRVLWTGNDSTYPGRNGNFKVNMGVIAQFGEDGTFTGSYYIPSIKCELESVDFADDEMYLLYNNCDNKGSRSKGYYTIAKVEKEEKTQLKALYHSFNVKYDTKGGTGTFNQYSTYVGKASKISNTKPTRNNYVFKAWRDPVTGRTYAPGSQFIREYNSINAAGSSAKPKVETDVTLEAVWTEAKYTVTYNANGGKNTPQPQTVGKTQDVNLRSDTPIRDGYEFKGWNTNKNATTVEYLPGAKYTGRSSMTLYAVWQANSVPQTIEIRYNPNGGTGGPTVTTGTSGNIVLDSATPRRDNYVFLGWQTGNGVLTKIYSAGEKVPFTTNTTLYAVWASGGSVTLSYDMNGGSGSIPAHSGALGEIKVSNIIPERNGYYFEGWATSRGGAVAYFSGEQYHGTADQKLYAVWTEESISVNYYFCKSVNSIANPTVVKKTTPMRMYTIPEEAQPERTGHKFLGWSAESCAGTVKYNPGDLISVENEDVNLYAIWIESGSLVLFDVNGGNLNAPIDTKVDDETVVPQGSPTRSGYNFVGWSQDPDVHYASYQSGDLIIVTFESEELLLYTPMYAVWEEDDDSGDALEIDDISGDYDDEWLDSEESSNPKTSVMNILTPLAVLLVGSMGFMVAVLRRRRG